MPTNCICTDPLHPGDAPACPVHGKQTTLATINFVHMQSENLGARRFYTRAHTLSLHVARHMVLCADCGTVIEKGQYVAVEEFSSHYCLNCVAEMPEAEALKQSDKRAPDAAQVARLRGNKYGVASGKQMQHQVHVNTVAGGGSK